MEQAAKEGDSAEDVPVTKQDHQRAAWHRADHLAVELSRAAASDSARWSHFLRLHGGFEAVPLRPERLQGNPADDRGHIQR